MAFKKSDKLKMEQLAEKYNLTVEEVELIVKTPSDFIREKTRELNFEDDLSEEEFDKLKTNFNIPAIGKMYASYFLYRKIQENKKKKKLQG